LRGRERREKKNRYRRSPCAVGVVYKGKLLRKENYANRGKRGRNLSKGEPRDGLSSGRVVGKGDAPEHRAMKRRKGEQKHEVFER